MQRARDMATSAALYGQSALRVARRARRLGAEERLVFVVGSPRSGTTFTGSALGSLPGFVDLDEVQPWKAAIPSLVGRPDDEAGMRLRRILERVRRLGLARGLRGVEQTPETSFVLTAVLRAYPAGGRRPRDPRRPRRRHVASRARLAQRRADGRRRRGSRLRRARALLGRAGPRGGVRSRLGRNARRLGVASLRHARPGPCRSGRSRCATSSSSRIRLRRRLRWRPSLGVDADQVADAFARAHDTSAGRWRRDLTPDQLADVEREAGAQLVALGYELSSTQA